MDLSAIHQLLLNQPLITRFAIIAGGHFFSSIAREGATLAKLALLIVSMGGAITWIGPRLLELPTELAVTRKHFKLTRVHSLS